MPSRDAARRPRPSVTLPIVLWLAITASLLPVLRVIRPDAWLAGAIGIVGLVLLAGWIARALKMPAVGVSVAEAAVAGIALTVMFARETSLLAVIPTVETFRSIPVAIDGAVTQIVEGAAPLEAWSDLAFVIVAACALLAIALDHVVVTARMPLLAAVALIAVYLIPAIAVPSGPRATEFIVFGVAILLLIGTETRVRERLRLAGLGGRAPRPRASGGVVATAIGAVAVVTALVVAPALPQPTRATGSGTFVAGSAIDASLSLGENLRQPASIEVLRVDSDAPSPPYLRAVTLSEFDGVTWEHDRDRGTDLGDAGFGGLPVADGIEVEEFTTDIEVVNYVSPWLPIPYAAVGIEGLEGDWVAIDENRTILTRAASPVGQTYTVTSQVVEPTLEQIRAARAVEPGGGRDTISLDADEELLGPIRALAEEVTEGLASDYDRLVALQTWFRSAFQYSLDAPVEEGFDGTGLDAISAFLQERSGYCVHFASAFAVMARTMDMPSRIVVGYLPGTLASDFTAGESYFSVGSTQLHAWPEVWFEGLGWIPFEPTASLGTPTRFAPGTPGEPQPGAEDSPDTAPETPETDAPEPGAAPEIDEGDAIGSNGPIETRPAAPPIALGLLALLLLAVPAVARIIIRARRLSAATNTAPGAVSASALAVWDEVVDSVTDFGIALPPGESPRALGARLIREHGVDPETVAPLVAAIEWASYADASSEAETSAAAPAGGLARAVRDLRQQLSQHASGVRRILATALPRSLVTRTSTVAAARRTARAR